MPKANLANCDETITLDCLRALYSVNYTPVSTAHNTYGIGKWFERDSTSFAHNLYVLSRIHPPSILGRRSRPLFQEFLTESSWGSPNACAH